MNFMDKIDTFWTSDTLWTKPCRTSAFGVMPERRKKYSHRESNILE
jgi:hypothetical protein